MDSRSRSRRERLISDLRQLKERRLFGSLSPDESKTARRGWRYVGWAIRKDLDLPNPSSPATDAFRTLFTVDDIPESLSSQLVTYLIRRLGALARLNNPHPLESGIPAILWLLLIRQADSATIALLFKYVESRTHDWDVWPKPVEGILQGIDLGWGTNLDEHKSELEKILSDLIERFPRVVKYEYGPWYNFLFPRAAEIVITREDLWADWRSWLLRLLQHYSLSIFRISPTLGDLAARIFECSDCEHLIEGYRSEALIELHDWNPVLFNHLQELVPSRVALVIAALWDSRVFTKAEWKWSWQEDDSERRVKRALEIIASPVLEQLALPIGLAVGLNLARRELSLSSGGEILKRFGLSQTSELPQPVIFQICLWRELQLLARHQQEPYRRQTEILGVQTRIMEMVVENPAGWAQALPWLLECAQHLDRFAESVTVELADRSTQVREEIDRLAEQGKSDLIRDIASGIRAVCNGVSNPSERLWQDLLSFASRQLDGSSFRPEPLAAASSTWLSSYSIEVLLRSTATTAESAFQDYFTDQGGVEEEAVTSRLLSELEYAFRATQGRVKGLGRKSLFVVSLSQRQVRKREEKVYGCDIAFLVTVTSPWSKGVKTTELVQVKKPIREGRKKSFVDRWRIDAPQLSDLLKWSPGAVYWLFGVRGEVLVVPGKFLQAMNPVRRLGIQGKDFHVDYLRVRSAAIPLSQFLIDLLVGLWLGTTDEEALRFARGEASASPRFIVEVEIDLSGERHQ